MQEAKGIKDFLGYVVIIGLFLFVGYAFLRSIIGDILLKKNGVCTKAVLYMETYGAKTGYDLGYKFFIGGKEYDGLVSERGGLKIGDTICVVYLQSFPGIHKSVGQLGAGSVKCDCK